MVDGYCSTLFSEQYRIVMYMIRVAVRVSLLSFCNFFAELFEGDILLDPKTQQIVDGMTTFDAVKSETQKWTNARVPYIFDSNFGIIFRCFTIPLFVEILQLEFFIYLAFCKSDKILYILIPFLDSQRRQVVQQAINEYNKYTCIRFVPRTNEKNYVKFIIGGG